VRRDPGDPLRRLSDVNRRFLLVLATAVTVVIAALAVQLWSNRPGEVPAAASTSPHPPAAIPAGAVEGNDAEPWFKLRIRAGPGVYRAGEPIQVWAWLTYTGPKPQEKLVASGSGLVQFSWEQQDGQRRQDGAGTADCAPYSIDRTQVLAVPFAKSGGFSGDDPDAGFWRQYFQDPVLRLPAGRYRIHALTNFFVGECGGPEHRLDAAVKITVLP
jgi:hypothetical protein